MLPYNQTDDLWMGSKGQLSYDFFESVGDIECVLVYFEFGPVSSNRWHDYRILAYLI